MIILAGQTWAMQERFLKLKDFLKCDAFWGHYTICSVEIILHLTSRGRGPSEGWDVFPGYATVIWLRYPTNSTRPQLLGLRPTTRFIAPGPVKPSVPSKRFNACSTSTHAASCWAGGMSAISAL
jgi:hypothetical protein